MVGLQGDHEGVAGNEMEGVTVGMPGTLSALCVQQSDLRDICQVFHEEEEDLASYVMTEDINNFEIVHRALFYSFSRKDGAVKCAVLLAPFDFEDDDLEALQPYLNSASKYL